VWDVSWTTTDAALSISADGVIKQWDSTSGQVLRTLPAHTLGLVSLSVSPDGKQALYNSIEGLTCLWDLESGEIVGKHESYVRTGSVPTEPCKHQHLHSSHLILVPLAFLRNILYSRLVPLVLNLIICSLVCVPQPKGR
jgi:WD40 repeat protein